MNADQFFYLLFCTITKREVFGVLTYYYCDVLMYTLLFGLTMFVMPRFTMNSCMLYRDSFLVVVGLAVHVLYIVTGNQLILFGNLGLYVVYLVADWKNDALTHMGMKICGKIKDDDSFEGDFPMKMPRRRIEMTRANYELIPDIVRKKSIRMRRNLINHKILVEQLIDNTRKELQAKGDDMYEDDASKKMKVRMRFGQAVYKLIFFIKFRHELQIDKRDKTYQEALSLLVSATNQGGTENLERAQNEPSDGRIDELDEEQEENDKMSQFGGSKSCRFRY